MQSVICKNVDGKLIKKYLNSCGCERPLLVCGKSFDLLPFSQDISDAVPGIVRFGGFSPNPEYSDICEGVKYFIQYHCDSIIAVGGGSAIDVAKCIKLYSAMDIGIDYLSQTPKQSNTVFYAIPTTAGSGSESTANAVIYKDGKKVSVAHDCLLPDIAFLDGRVLDSLPVYQKKCTVLDALCQAIESWWSVYSTFESRELAERAAVTIKNNIDDYLNNPTDKINDDIMLASNLAGRAIRITRTTVPHAMAYKLTTYYGLPHGHAVALTLPYIWRKTINNAGGCTDLRGFHFCDGELKRMAAALGFKFEEDAVCWFEQLLDKYGILPPEKKTENDVDILVDAFDMSKTRFCPCKITKDDIIEIYESLLKK